MTCKKKDNAILSWSVLNDAFITKEIIHTDIFKSLIERENECLKQDDEYK